MSAWWRSFLNDFHWKAFLIYLDDVVTYSKSFEEHQTHIEQIFNKMKNAELKLNLKECQLFRKEVKYLGHIILESSITTDPEKA